MIMISSADQVVGDRCVIKFGATWCAPCKKIAPLLETLTTEFPEVKFYEVDCDDSPEISKQFGVRALPTIVFLHNQKEISRAVGMQLMDALRKAVRDLSNLSS